MARKNRTFAEAIKDNPEQFKRDVFKSYPRNKQELVRNLADYNENVLMLLTGDFNRRYPRAPKINDDKKNTKVSKALSNILGKRQSAKNRMESRFRRMR